jgi:hypothetical protein
MQSGSNVQKVSEAPPVSILWADNGNVPSSTQTKATGASVTFLHLYHTTQCQASVYSHFRCLTQEFKILQS